MENSQLIILTGKTAAGKDTVMLKLLARLPDIKRVVTTTSRPPRPGEKNGVDYYFVSADDFKKKIDSGDFIEYVSYGGNFYGTEKTQITDNLNCNLIWRIDPSRAGQIKELLNRPAKVIYLTVDDKTVVERLKQRGYSDQKIAVRMKEDARFWQQYQGNYNHVVENIPGQLDKTVDQIINIIGSILTPRVFD